MTYCTYSKKTSYTEFTICYLFQYYNLFFVFNKTPIPFSVK